MAADLKNVWYFAYGSNMSSTTFTGDRGINPLSMARVRLPGWTLTMDIPGTPYSEPAFTSIRPIRRDDCKEREVVGVAYLLSPDQLISVIGSEGGGIAYSNIVIAGAEPVDSKTAERTGSHLTVHTFGTALARSPPARPSERYMKIVLAGANEADLSDDYQHYLKSLPVYQPSNNIRHRLGGHLFLAFWLPVMTFAKLTVTATVSSNGMVPFSVAYFVRAIIITMWFAHDHLHAPLWGCGDGLEVLSTDN